MYAQYQGDEGTAFCEDCDDDRGPGVSQNKADFAHCANAHEYYASNQAVAEGQVINRLQEVNLHDVNQCSGVCNQGIQEQSTKLAAFHEEHAAVDTNHAHAHGNHDQGLKNTFKA